MWLYISHAVEFHLMRLLVKEDLRLITWHRDQHRL